jgi:hypothetical protein
LKAADHEAGVVRPEGEGICLVRARVCQQPLLMALL